MDWLKLYENFTDLPEKEQQRLFEAMKKRCSLLQNFTECFRYPRIEVLRWFGMPPLRES
jgi:hypothetical protein